MSTQRARIRKQRQISGSPEWYTPRWLLARVAAFLGPDYCDPCPPAYGDLGAGADFNNGLVRAWGARTFLNPPYGRDILPWIRKAITEQEQEQGSVREPLLLVPAYVETRWFQPLYGPHSSLLFFAGRLYFERPGQPLDARGHPDPATERAPHPSVLVYRTARPAPQRHRAFADAFCDLGTIMRVSRARVTASAQLALWPTTDQHREKQTKEKGQPLHAATA